MQCGEVGVLLQDAVLQAVEWWYEWCGVCWMVVCVGAWWRVVVVVLVSVAMVKVMVNEWWC